MDVRTLAIRTALVVCTAAVITSAAVAHSRGLSSRPSGGLSHHEAIEALAPFVSGHAPFVSGQSARQAAIIDDGVGGRSRPLEGPTPLQANDEHIQVDGARAEGAKYLRGAQNMDGGWGAPDSGRASDGTSDVATSSIVLLALHRDANGAHTDDDAIIRGVRYVLKSIAEAPSNSARLITPSGTQPQRKLGRLVDTHMAAMMLSEIAGTLDEATNIAMDRGFGQVIAKVQLAQRADGSFDGDGWAPVLSNSIAATSLMRAEDKGLSVDPEVLDRSEQYQAAQVALDGTVDTSSGAGVELYAVAGSLRTNSLAKKRAASPNKSEASRADLATRSRVSRDQEQLMAGFGSIGGEEMLGYMMISDSLAEEGGDRWSTWEQKVGEYLVGIQNADGSWAGHHCITSRTFTTAAAVMTLGSGDWAERQAATPPNSGPTAG